MVETRTYLNYMKDSVRPVVIAVPTHELKRQIFYDANLHGIEAICATPDIAAYGISEEVTEEMQDFTTSEQVHMHCSFWRKRYSIWEKTTRIMRKSPGF